MKTSKKLVILEGPDGAGKTTLAAKLVAGMIGDPHYEHCGPYRDMSDGLPRLYVEAMAPALLGLSSVVLDRSWLSEGIYGPIYRGGSRLQPYAVSMLERIAARCETIVVLCLPPLETCLEAWRTRASSGDEYVKAESTMKLIHAAYRSMPTTLPTVIYDYTQHSEDALHRALRTVKLTEPHPLRIPSAGNLRAPIVIVGEKFAEVKNQDSRWQYPFVSFNKGGCSAWLTEQVALEMSEDQVLWVNADVPAVDLVSLIEAYPRKLIVTLGAEATTAVRELNWSKSRVVSCEHPARAKRFHSSSEYPLRYHLRNTLTDMRST